MRLNKLNDSVLTVNYTVERERKKGRKQHEKKKTHIERIAQAQSRI